MLSCLVLFSESVIYLWMLQNYLWFPSSHQDEWGAEEGSLEFGLVLAGNRGTLTKEVERV